MMEDNKTKELGCDVSKCKARCCHNVALPVRLFQYYPDKMVRKPVAVTPAYSDNVYVLQRPEDQWDGINPCPWLTRDNRCSIYENRPEICKLWGHSELTPLLGCQDLGCKEHKKPEETPVYMLLEAPEEVYQRITGEGKPKISKEVMRYYGKHRSITLDKLKGTQADA